MATTALQIKDRGLDELLARAAKKVDAKVLIGIPEATSSRSGAITNAELAFIHSHGSPVHNIPARPFLEPAIEDPATMEAMKNELKAAALAAIDGDMSAVRAELDKCGFYGENAAKMYIGDRSKLAPNAESTIRRKGSDAPLIDTGALRQAITHIVDMGGDSGNADA